MTLAIPPHKEWLTAAEAAAEQLEGLQFTEQHIRRFLAGGAIATRKRAGRGGGREFHWTSLPDAARAAYLKRHGVETPDRIDDAGARCAAKDIVAEARAAIVEAAKAFVADRGLPACKGLKAFSAAFARRRVKLPHWVFVAVPHIQPHMLRTWDRIVRARGPLALRDNRGRPKGSRLFDRDEELRGYCVSKITAHTAIAATQLQAFIALPREGDGEGRYGLGRDVPLRTLQDALKHWRAVNAPTLKALTNPDRHRSHHMPAFGSRSADVVVVNGRWEMDATRADAMSILPDGRKVRFAIMALVDVFTRRAMMVVTDQPRGDATRALIRRAILAWGLPGEIKTDNGKEFDNFAVRDFCARLGIALTFADPFRPDQKPHVESFFGTFNHELLPYLPDYVGHNIEARKAIESRKSFAHRHGEEARITFQTSISPEGLQARADAWLANLYETRVHGGIGLAPRDKALAHAGDARAIDDPRLLDVLMTGVPEGGPIRVVQKKGIAVAGRYYIAAELGRRVGYRVSVRIDPLDRGRIHVYTHDGAAFLCIAEDPDVTGADRAAIAVGAHRDHRAYLRVVRSEARALNARHPSAGIMDRLLTHAAGDGFMPTPQAQEAMQLAAPLRLIAQREALAAIDEKARGPQPIEVTEEQREAAASVMAEMPARAQPRAGTVQCDGYERPDFGDDDVAFWLWAMDWKAQGLTLDAGDTALVAELDRSPTFQLMLSTARNKSAAGAA